MEIPEAPVHGLFEAQAARAPGAVAATFQGVHLTYAGLNARADRLARRLRSLGVGPEVLVGVALDRSPGLLTAVLGVLKAGGAYLPLDPEYPAERLALMLQDSGVRVLLTESRLAAALPPHEAEVVLLDAPAAPLAPVDGADLEGDAGAANLAYVIYTSGSTGRPKGVQVTRGALANFLAAMGRAPGLRPEDTLLAVTSLSFDIAVLELLLPLLTGARVEIATAEETGDGARLLARLRASGATVVQATPATWRMLLDAGWGPADRLRLALTGGEALPGELAEQLRQRAGEVWNVYGPTETTVWSSALRLGEDGGAPPVGHPIANTRIHVVDRRLRPLPVGVPGEVVIGGDGVARGYLGRPELTAERFVPDPWSPRGGERLYRTGDLGRFLPDGRIELRGRIDFQVKIRGHRIELGEIEAALALHPGVAQAVVVARDDWGDRRLVAYVVPVEGEAPTAAELRAFLRGRLPEPMEPAAFVSLPALPLTPNRKIDRKALPVPAAGAAAGAYAAPRDPVEEVLAGIWAEVLRVESGRHRRRLLRPRRPLPARHPGRLARPAGPGRGAAGALDLRAPDGARLRRPARGGGEAGRLRAAADLPHTARRRPAALLRPGAVLVPRSSGARRLRLQHLGGGHPDRRASTWRPSPRASPRSSAATRPCARSSPPATAGRRRSWGRREAIRRGRSTCRPCRRSAGPRSATASSRRRPAGRSTSRPARCCAASSYG